MSPEQLYLISTEKNKNTKKQQDWLGLRQEWRENQQ